MQIQGENLNALRRDDFGMTLGSLPKALGIPFRTLADNLRLIYGLLLCHPWDAWMGRLPPGEFRFGL